MGHQWPPALVNQRPSRQNQINTVPGNFSKSKTIHIGFSDKKRQ